MWNAQNGKFKCHAALRIHGPKVIPEMITKTLGIQPSKTFLTSQGGSWIFSTEAQVDNLLPLGKHLEELLKVITPQKSLLKDIQEFARTDVFCFFASESDLGEFSIEAEILRTLGDLGLAFGLDQYFCCNR